MSETSDDTDKNDASVINNSPLVLASPFETLNETEENDESALENPVEYLMAKNFFEFEEIRDATLRNKEDIATRLAQLESDLIEDVSLEDTSADLKDLHAGIENMESTSDKVIEGYETLSRVGNENITNVLDELHLIDGLHLEIIDGLKNTSKSFEERIAVIQANKELASKLKDKLYLINAFLQKSSSIIENETVPTNPDELESSIQEHDALLDEFNQLQVIEYSNFWSF